MFTLGRKSPFTLKTVKRTQIQNIYILVFSRFNKHRILFGALARSEVVFCCEKKKTLLHVTEREQKQKRSCWLCKKSRKIDVSWEGDVFEVFSPWSRRPAQVDIVLHFAFSTLNICLMRRQQRWERSTWYCATLCFYPVISVEATVQINIIFFIIPLLFFKFHILILTFFF